MSRRPGTPRLLRQLNDRAALELLMSTGPLTRTQLGQATGLSKVTASQLLSRLQERELVHIVGAQAGGRGPNAALYDVVPSSAYVAGLDVGPTEVTAEGPQQVTAAIADITGQVVTESTIDLAGESDPVSAVHTTVMRLVERAEVPLDRLRAFVIGTPGVVDPRTGDIRFSFNLPSWHEGVLELLRADLQRSVIIENDVNLAAFAERSLGAARNTDDFVLLWIGAGVGMAIMLGGQLHRGHAGGAGEIGWLPVPGAPLPEEVGLPEGYHGHGEPAPHPALGYGLQSLIGARATCALAAEHGLPSDSVSVAFTAARSGTDGGEAFLDEMSRRIARAVTAVSVILDPGLIVLGADVVRAGGDDLAQRIRQETRRLGLEAPDIQLSQVDGNPVLRGAVLSALDAAREELFSTTTE
ncbi:ROK family transcriptional regulator [Lipingzhangella sp. LS1_29]|uniref:ROK family transcriptional regulator n=1 Tax=Lipingzhangella rawalii TaxID=2055835 RepID=A0ABU2H8T2_9ACTN|nr:ROK family transcriptional regulator [Lipingzhangella rawalii]MDS1271683.1 ROK family transcriptional regulator [Lipingzhangella rawalii]